jgi:hypothetical protein
MDDSTTLSSIWDPSFRVVRSKSDVICDKERTAHSSFLHGDQRDIFELPEDTEYVEEIETGGDGLLHDPAGSSRTGEGHQSGDYDCTDDDINHNLPDNRRGVPACTGVRSRLPDKEDAPPVSGETLVHTRHLHDESDKTRQTAALTKASYQPQPPCTNHVTRSQVTMSANELIIMANTLASTSINRDPFTYVDAMDSLQRDDWKRAMEVECISILLNNTFTTINSWEARQLQVKPIGSNWVY